MLKKTAVFLVVIAVVFLSQITVFAADTTAKTESTTNDINSIYDTSALYNSLSDDVKQSLENIGINGIDGQQICSCGGSCRADGRSVCRRRRGGMP